MNRHWVRVASVPLACRSAERWHSTCKNEAFEQASVQHTSCALIRRRRAVLPSCGLQDCLLPSARRLPSQLRPRLHYPHLQTVAHVIAAHRGLKRSGLTATSSADFLASLLMQMLLRNGVVQNTEGSTVLAPLSRLAPQARSRVRTLRMHLLQPVPRAWGGTHGESAEAQQGDLCGTSWAGA